MRKKMLENEESDENEVDDPSEVEELQNNGTDDDWSPAPEKVKARRSTRPKAIKRRFEEEASSDDSESEELGADAIKAKRGSAGARGKGRGRGRGGRGGGMSIKKTKTDEEEDVGETSSDSDSGDTPTEYKSGAYVILKADFKSGGDHPLWKIDGKSLLQKYIFERENEDGMPTYKSTTIYAAWSKSAKESYYPINVENKTQQGKDHIITFDRSQVKEDEENPE